jgi:hypothetical protein
MDSPAKRRKTSPTTSVPVDAPTTPSRIPVPPQDGAKALPGRPSFASPTKASIARHNPQLLKRPSSSGSGTERPESRGKADDVFAKVLGEIRPKFEGQTIITGEDRQRTESDGSTTQGSNEAPRAETPTASQPATRSTQSVGGGLSAKPRRIFQSPVKLVAKPVETVAANEVGGDMQDNVNPFQKNGLRRSPIPSQDAEVAQETIDPFKKTGLRRSPVAPQPVKPTEQNNPQTREAEVSTTPTGPVPSQAVDPVAGSDAPRRQEPAVPSTRTQRPLVSQPTEPIPSTNTTRLEEPELPLTPTQRGLADPIVTTPPTGIHETPSKRARKSNALAEKLKSSPLKPRDPPLPEPPEPQPKPHAEKPKRRKSTRFFIPEDTHASKKKVRDDLLKELQGLQADVALANKENDRLRLYYESKKSTPAAPPNPNELLSLLQRSTERPLTPKPKPVSIFRSIHSFLPFSSRRKPQSVLPIQDKPLPSHLPIALDDPLPYLQAFSPLTYTSNITLLPSEPMSSDSSSQEVELPILQRHLIAASHPSGLFSARLAMTVDTSVLAITSIEILKLDLNAENELGCFVRERASEEGTLGRNISVICWAMGRWVEVSVLRARFWCTVESEFGTAEARMKTLQKIAQRRKRKRRQDTSIGEDEEATGRDGNDEDEEARKDKWTRRQLLPHMGRTSMELSNDKVELRFEWKITFDWTGEVDSSISANSRIPTCCKFGLPFVVSCG